MEQYSAAAHEASAEFTEKKSVFIGTVAPVCGEDEAKAFVERISARFPDATHNVYAYILRGGAVMLRRGKPHVLQRGQRGEKPRLLKEIGNPAVDADTARVRRLQSLNQPQYRRLAAPALAEQRGDFSVGKMQRAAVEDGAVKALDYVFKGNLHFARAPFPSSSRKSFSKSRLTRIISSV